jgi:hypothetical protein
VIRTTCKRDQKTKVGDRKKIISMTIGIIDRAASMGIREKMDSGMWISVRTSLSLEGSFLETRKVI